MKVSTCLSLILLACTSLLHAQEVEDSVATEEEYQYIENEGDDAAATADSSSTYTPVTIHNLVSPEQLPATKDNASKPMSVRKFDDAKWKKTVGTETFQEKPEKPEEEDKKNKPTPEMPRLPWDSTVMQVVAYVVVIALIITIVYFFTKDLRFSTKVKATSLEEASLAAAVENIEQIDVTTPLQKALAEGNFKLATRLYFLDLLKRLHEGGYIAWKKDKTNRDYLMELYAKAFCYDEIRKLTLAYELVWYGEHTLPNENYQKLFAEFESIHQKINTPAAA
jgi:hypothetical protein